SDDLLDIGVEAEGCVRLVHGDAPDALSGSGMVTVDGALIEGPTCAEAIDDYEASQRQGLLRVNCGPSGAKANIMRSDETGVASLDCPAEIALEPGVYIVNVVKEDHQPWSDEVSVDPRQIVDRDVELPGVPLGTIVASGGGYF